ncbi:hypothetical protein [Xanthobacter flavus]|uniref:hypothetical protein n=1 Tax=Xanthobacter flavus TaxID=281 RepID=UPI003727EC47
MKDEIPGAGANGAAAVDLFGQPVQPLRDRRGRPSYAKSLENIDFVMVRAAAGWSHKAIADDMGIDEKTLRKHFSRELQSGQIRIKGMMLDVLLKRVRDEGHVPSVRLLSDLLEPAAPEAPRNRTGADEEDAKAAPVGKKEQRILDAQAVPDDYGDIFDRMRARH